VIEVSLLRREPNTRWRRFPTANYILLVTTREQTVQCPFTDEGELGSALVLAADRLTALSN
jgi:hypothetical protein